jgi:hypothetical protein
MYIPLSKRYRGFAWRTGSVGGLFLCGWVGFMIFGEELRSGSTTILLAMLPLILYIFVGFTFGAGRHAREYYVDENGITAVWFKRWERRYSWSDFVAVERMIVFYPAGFDRADCVVCTMIPPKILQDRDSAPYSYVTIDWTDAHPFKVLDIPLTEEQREEFWRYVPASLHPTPDNHTD